MVRRMRAPLLACCLVVTTPALAEKPPPLGVPWNGPNAPAPPSGKPAPIEGDRAAPPSPRTGFSFNQPELPSPGERAASSPPLTFRDVPPVRRGENVITYGFPLSGLLSSGPSLTTGNISALAGIRDNQGNFQISAAVQPGNSGGPLFDSRGNVIGVVVSKLNAARVAQLTGGDIPQNVNFAVKGTEALAFLRQNGIQPHVAASTGPEKRADEVDAVANPSTVYLQCFR
jgi:hypothetical protein